MALTNKKRYPNVTSRRKIPSIGSQAQRFEQTPITIVSVTLGTSTVVEFDQAVPVLKGIPQYASQLGALPTAAAKTAPNEITLTYAVAPTSIVVPFEDPGVRNGGGGYVSPGTFSDA